MITGTSGKTTTTRMLAYVLEKAGHRVGYTSTGGIVINGVHVSREDSSGYTGAKRVINDSSITVAVLEVARGDLLRIGLYRNRSRAAALLNVDREQIGIDGIATVAQMAELKKLVTDTATEAVVLNADDPQCIRFITSYPTRLLKLFSNDADNPVIKDHVDNDGIAYVVNSSVKGSIIQRWAGTIKKDMLYIDQLPACANGIFPQNALNVMAAAALAEGMQVPLETITKALGEFENSPELSPGRFNLIEDFSQTIIIDHAVTVPACASLSKSLKRISVDGSRICLLDGVGNRPDWHYTEIGQLLSSCFDQVICFENESYRRGRIPGEITELFKESFVDAGLAAENFHPEPDIKGAFETLSRLVQYNDLIAILTCEGEPKNVLSLLQISLERFLVKNDTNNRQKAPGNNPC